MDANRIQNLIDQLNYWDLRVSTLECNYFADEVELSYNDEDAKVFIKFLECYEVNFDHYKSYDKLRPVKEMTFPQMPYFLQDIQVSTKMEENINFYSCKINMSPLNLYICCKNIKIYRELN